jgi:16S rRNA (cytosine1402-N4)-methyltransferase
MILERLKSRGRVIGFDRDPQALSQAGNRLARFGDRLLLVHSNYKHLTAVLEREGVREISGALFDLGLSSLQLDDAERGFAYRFDGPLDLRFDQTAGRTAAEWLADASEGEIAGALRQHGGERHAGRIAQAIVAARGRTPLTRAGQLTRLIRSRVRGGGAAFGRTAARVFQALRIVVNEELAAISAGLDAALACMANGGRLLTIAYHSGEDLIAKAFLREAARVCRCAPVPCTCGAHPRGRLVQRRVIRATNEEIARNPRAKEARLRVFERIHGMGGGPS